MEHLNFDGFLSYYGPGSTDSSPSNNMSQHHADPTPRNARGETALDLAARFGRAAIVRSLVIDCPALVLQAAAESSALSDQKPASFPLHLAAKNGHLEVVTILLDAGFDIDFITEQGSALHVAALFGKIQVVKNLLNRRIATDSRDFQGRTVLEVLEEHENERASDLTQLMQNRDAWTECRRLIQDHITNQSTKDSTKNGSIQNGSVAMKRYENPNPQIELQGSPVWQRLPSSTADKIKSERPRHKSEDIPTTVLDGKHYRPPSLQAVFVEAEDAEIEQFELASTISLCTTIRDPAMSPGASSTVSSCNTFPIEDKRKEENQVMPNMEENKTIVEVEDCSSIEPIISESEVKIEEESLRPPSDLSEPTSSMICSRESFDISLTDSPAVKFAEKMPRRNSGTMAPLALPEDLGGSTTTDEGCRSPSPLRANLPPTPEEPPPSAWASESKIYDAIYPLSEDFRRSSLSNTPSPLISISNKEQETQVDDHISEPEPECHSSCSECASIRNTVSEPVMRQHAQLVKEHSRETTSPLDESAEWDKINDIMESFGGAICRESVFSDRFESQIGVYLKNRKSAALTLTLNNGTNTALDDYDVGLSAVACWLRQLGIQKWKEVVQRFETNGFDRIEFLRDTLNAEILTDLLMVETSELQFILNASQQLNPVPSAKRFQYVSDWLLALGCEDYLGRFMKAGYDSMRKVAQVGWTEISLEQKQQAELCKVDQTLLEAKRNAKTENEREKMDNLHLRFLKLVFPKLESFEVKSQAERQGFDEAEKAVSDDPDLAEPN